ncbi:hypothetical protein [Nocardia miyunensis]|uniref:hypothetical protein n=1 Tax=Nocardia miyunensis TaxID=282684 RepID=UPI000833D471|nr:hypothetical protein [Nocardia miyunensis]
MHTVFRDPGIPDGERTACTVLVEDRPGRLDLTGVITRERDGYASVIEARAEAGDFEMTVHQRFRRFEQGLHAESYCAESRSGGVVVSREEGRFLGVAHLQFGGMITPFQANVMPLLGGLILLRGLDFTEGAEESVDLWLAYSVHLPLSARIEQCANIDVPAGRIRCRQVRLRPRLPQLNMMADKVIGAMLPRRWRISRWPTRTGWCGSASPSGPCRGILGPCWSCRLSEASALRLRPGIRSEPDVPGAARPAIGSHR